MRASWLVLVTFSLITPLLANAQPQAPRDPQAVALAGQALTALTGRTQINDVTLTGTVTRTAGSDTEEGNVTLKALGLADSRFDLSLPSGQRSGVRNSANGFPQGYWITPDGTVHTVAAHNCLVDAAWFFPALSSLAAITNPNLAMSYIGSEIQRGIPVQHIRFWLYEPNSGAPDFIAQVSTMDFYLDSQSFLPVMVTFNTHPEGDGGTNIPVEIDFSNYQVVNGDPVPFHIQKFLNGSLLLDVTVQAVTLNSGLTDSDFSVQ